MGHFLHDSVWRDQWHGFFATQAFLELLCVRGATKEEPHRLKPFVFINGTETSETNSDSGGDKGTTVWRVR